MATHIHLIKPDYEALVDALDDLRDARVAAARIAEWKADSTTARPYDQIRAEMLDNDLPEK